MIGSILGPLFFNLFINDLFLFIDRTNTCNFADDNTVYSGNISLQTISKDLKYDMQNILKCFKRMVYLKHPITLLWKLDSGLWVCPDNIFSYKDNFWFEA